MCIQLSNGYAYYYYSFLYIQFYFITFKYISFQSACAFCHVYKFLESPIAIS